jgi:hypothetical protein
MLASMALGVLVVLVARAPRAATPPIVDAVACMRADVTTQSAIRTQVLQKYSPSYKGCTLDVGFDACVPAGVVTSMFVESGFGHGMGTTLTITSLTRASDDRWDVTRLELLSGKGSAKMWDGQGTDGVRVLRGSIASTALDAAVERARVLASVTSVEREPPGFGGGGWMSSCDFHASLSFTAGGAPFAIEYTGYVSNDAQTEYIALRLAVDGVEDAIPKTSLAETPLDGAARTLFVDRITANATTFDESFHWWVREDFLSAAGDAGDARLLPLLVRYLSAHPAPDDTSGFRSRSQAINAIALLTRDDRRLDAQGLERNADDVAADYLKKPPKP